MAATIRRLAPGDLDDLAALVRSARERGDLTGCSDPEGEFFLRFAAVEPATIAVVVIDDRPVGWVSPELKVLVVEPAVRRSGIGRALVEAGLAIEVERGRPNLLLGPPPGDEGAIAFLTATGFSPHSTLWDLELTPDRAVPPAVWPADAAVRAYDRDDDLDAWVRLFNAAFADHATPLQLDASTMREIDDEPDRRDDDLLLVTEADDPDAPIAFCATEPRRIDGVVQPTAEVWTIGVHPDRQGLGLGRQLLRWGVTHLRAMGVQTVTLSVNGRNERALTLYESEGFVRTRTRDRWARPAMPPSP